MEKKSLWLRLTLLMIFNLSLFPMAYAVSNSIIAVDKGGVGQYTSMVLDASGNPIISFYDAATAKLKVVHCFDKNCSTFNAILTPDSASQVGQYTSIALDKNGNPVVSYYDQGNANLKVLHCGNSSCSTGNTLSSPDVSGNVGQYTSITVDANNQPVVSYYDATKGILKILHCGNAACNAGNSIVTPDTTTSNGVQSSIKLNTIGNPIVAYFDFTKHSLKILRCGNGNCTAGNSISTVDAAADVGRYPSLNLDTNGNPAVSYLDLTNGKLKVLRCGNSTCSTGNIITSIGANGIVIGYFSSLMLDSNNRPVVSYYDSTNGDLNILRCGNSTCTSSNIIMSVDTIGQVGLYTSLKLDSSSNPIVSYYDATNGDLKVLHCGSQNCNTNSLVVADNTANVGQYTSLKLDANGKPVVSYWDETNGHLKLIHCGDANCSTGNSITNPDVGGNTGWDTSLQLDINGYPVISYFDSSSNVMKVLHCNNANCMGVNTSITPDILSQRLSSMTLDKMGHPVIASSGQANQGLRIVHCGDATCSTNNTITSPDFPVFPFNADVRGVSLVLDASGNPIVSFYRADQAQLKVLHCVDPACNGPANSIALPDPGAQAPDHRSTSLILDANGNPVIAYQDSANNSNILKVLHCGNPNCTAGNSISAAQTGLNVGSEPSIQLDATGNPVVSYATGSGMTILHCGNTTCTAGNTITATDSPVGGWDSSLALDANGNPVVSYYNATGDNLKILHCSTKKCE